MTRLRSNRSARRQSHLCVAMAALWLGCSMLLTPVSAEMFSASIDSDLYGDLIQGNVPDIGGCACGPTSVVNSLVYLQNERPDLYDTDLVPYAGASPTQAEMAAVATTLGGEDYMDTGNNDGTFIEDFIFGKQKYLEEKAPGKTRYAAQVAVEWRDGVNNTDPPQPTNLVPKPDWVQDETAPTLDFIYRQIRDREDVEIFVFGGGAHYLTVTGIEYDDTTNTGTLSFIDPGDGMAAMSDIVGLETIDGMDFIELDYELTAGENTFIGHAVSESPIPEPAAIALLVIGLVGLCGFRRQASFHFVSQA